MYFAIYQALAQDERRPGLYKEYPPDFFDLIIVDECHRGSANAESSWREILEYFQPAIQLGMTATPLREDNRDTYNYFGNPIYQYSLRQGIADGFLAPYRVHRVITHWDAAGWRPSKNEMDRFGRAIPDEEYQTKDFKRVIALRARTEAIAKHLSDFMKRTDRFAKTIVFCVDQEHADEMRRALNNFNSDLVGSTGVPPVPSDAPSDGTNAMFATNDAGTNLSGETPALPGGFPDYICRVTSDEGVIGRGHLSRFQELETDTPVILTTSQLLTTGVDAPTCKNIVLARVVNSMTEFKQIIGRGTRVRDDYGKLFFNILDYTGSATGLFADPDFDGEPITESEEKIDEKGNVIKRDVVLPEASELSDGVLNDALSASIGERDGVRCRFDDSEGERRKFYFDGGKVEIAAHLVYELDAEGKQLRVVQFIDYAGEKVRTLFPSAPELREQWANPEKRSEIINRLAERGIDFDELAAATKQPNADPFDLLCHVAYNAPLRTRRERADRLRKEKRDFFDQFGAEAKAILTDLLEKYAEHGTAQFVVPDVLKVLPLFRVVVKVLQWQIV